MLVNHISRFFMRLLYVWLTKIQPGNYYVANSYISRFKRLDCIFFLFLTYKEGRVVVMVGEGKIKVLSTVWKKTPRHSPLKNNVLWNSERERERERPPSPLPSLTHTTHHLNPSHLFLPLFLSLFLCTLLGRPRLLSSSSCHPSTHPKYFHNHFTGRKIIFLHNPTQRWRRRRKETDNLKKNS